MAAQETASGKQFAVVGGVTLLQPRSDANTDGGPAPTVSFSYYLNDNMAIELWGAADTFHHRVRDFNGAKLGSMEQRPVALSGQYQFGHADSIFRPLLGAGYYRSSFSNQKINAAAGVLPQDQVSLKTAQGFIGTAGVDMNINATWFARADARYLHSRPQLTIGGKEMGARAKLDPWTVGFGIGARF
jgi:outer membrane protein